MLVKPWVLIVVFYVLAFYLFKVVYIYELVDQSVLVVLFLSLPVKLYWF